MTIRKTQESGTLVVKFGGLRPLPPAAGGDETLDSHDIPITLLDLDDVEFVPSNWINMLTGQEANAEESPGGEEWLPLVWYIADLSDKPRGYTYTFGLSNIAETLFQDGSAMRGIVIKIPEPDATSDAMRLILPAFARYGFVTPEGAGPTNDIGFPYVLPLGGAGSNGAFAQPDVTQLGGQGSIPVVVLDLSSAFLNWPVVDGVPFPPPGYAWFGNLITAGINITNDDGGEPVVGAAMRDEANTFTAHNVFDTAKFNGQVTFGNQPVTAEKHFRSRPVDYPKNPESDGPVTALTAGVELARGPMDELLIVESKQLNMVGSTAPVAPVFRVVLADPNDPTFDRFAQFGIGRTEREDGQPIVALKAWGGGSDSDKSDILPMHVKTPADDAADDHPNSAVNKGFLGEVLNDVLGERLVVPSVGKVEDSTGGASNPSFTLGYTALIQQVELGEPVFTVGFGFANPGAGRYARFRLVVKQNSGGAVTLDGMPGYVTVQGELRTGADAYTEFECLVTGQNDEGSGEPVSVLMAKVGL